jgi:hypothetical protein
VASSDFPGRPKVLKGALAVYPTQTPGAQPSKIIIFQFNPDQLRRSLAHRSPPAPAGKASTGAAREDALRAAGPPVETITLTVDLNAADQLESPDDNPLVAEYGLNPAIATLEMLMYPPIASAQKSQELASQGSVEVQPPNLPLVLLVWNKSRVVPVKLTSFSVTEDAFDTRLNPISAKIELSMQVLTYMEFPTSSVGLDAFTSYQQQKENLAAADQPSPAVSGIRNLLP